MKELNWEYSRNQKSHSIIDGCLYRQEETPENLIPELWVIKARGNGWYIHRPKIDGYDLWHKGKKVKWATSVKELKKYVEEFENV